MIDVNILLKFINLWFSRLVDEKIVEYMKTKGVEDENDRLLSSR